MQPPPPATSGYNPYSASSPQGTTMLTPQNFQSFGLQQRSFNGQPEYFDQRNSARYSPGANFENYSPQQQQQRMDASQANTPAPVPIPIWRPPQQQGLQPG